MMLKAGINLPEKNLNNDSYILQKSFLMSL